MNLASPLALWHGKIYQYRLAPWKRCAEEQNLVSCVCTLLRRSMIRLSFVLRTVLYPHEGQHERNDVTLRRPVIPDSWFIISHGTWNSDKLTDRNLRSSAKRKSHGRLELLVGC